MLENKESPLVAVAAPPRRFHAHVHRLRGIAILGVVSMHAVSVLGDPLSGPFGVVFDVLFGEGSPVFLMISGFLFQEALRKFVYPRFLSRKFKNVVVPYLIVSVPALALYLSGLKNSHPWLSDDFLDANPLVQLGGFLVTGAHLGPLWFIPMILLFFVFSPVFVFVDRHPWLYWSLPPLLVVTVLVPRPELNSNPLQSFVHFCSLFVLGMLLARHHDAVRAGFDRHRAAWLVAGFSVVALLAVAATSVGAVDTLARGGFGVTMLFVLSAWPALGWLGWLLDRLGEASFPIFFLHGYPIAAVRAFDLRPEMPTATWLAVWAGVTVVTAVGTAAVAFGVRALAGKRSRYLIGM